MLLSSAGSVGRTIKGKELSVSLVLAWLLGVVVFGDAGLKLSSVNNDGGEFSFVRDGVRSVVGCTLARMFE